MPLTSTREARADTLERALIAAYQNNPNLLAARAELRSVDEAVPQALSGWRPNVSAAAEAGKSRSLTESGFFSAEENRNPRTLTIVEVEQPDGVIVQFGGQTPLNLADRHI